MSPRHATRDDRAVVFLVAARLLAYPDDDLVADLPVLRAALSRPSAAAGAAVAALAPLVDHLATTPLLELQQHYVTTFDLKRRCCLYLTYYLNGDTRRRGMALWRFQETYRLGGMRPTSGELPDFLPVVLEFAADDAGTEAAALSLLDEHREGLEVLAAALDRFASPYSAAVRAVVDVLPELTPAQREAAARLVAEGPPSEHVGLEPFTLTDISAGARA